MMNWLRMLDLRAPMAFLIPISLVLSVTETSIIFIMPIPPTNKDITAMPPRINAMVPVMSSRVSRICAELKTLYASSDKYVSKRKSSIRDWVSATFSLSLTSTVNVLIVALL